MDVETKEILFRDYQRHLTKQPEKVLELLAAMEAEFPGQLVGARMRHRRRGPLRGAPLGGKFVQEVNAVTLAVEHLHPDVGSVIELGGQDAKIIVFKEDQHGNKTANPSMNDKCASGTGATIDKCMVKVGMPNEEVVKLHFDATKLHHVAAKCGVFAETDIVNLVKSGIPSHEILCSLADAIVLQNLSVLTRGNTLRHKVLLLGGPNTYLPFLQECWRLRIPETWRERGYEPPAEDVPIEELIFVPENAQYYAAFGAVCTASPSPPRSGATPASPGCATTCRTVARPASATRPARPLAANEAETSSPRSASSYKIPEFAPPKLGPGEVVRAVIGLDGGSTSSKAVLIDEESRIVAKAYQLSKGNPIQDTKELLAQLNAITCTDSGGDPRGASASAPPATPPTCSRRSRSPTSTSSRPSRT